MQTTVNKYGADMVRDYNQKMLYNLVRMNEGISRADLTRITKMSPTTIGKIIGILIDEGLVVESGTKIDGKIGRKAMKLSIVANGILAIGINFDVHQIEASVVNIAGEIIKYTKCSNTADISPEQAISKIAMLVQDLLNQLGTMQKKNVIGIGINVPGVISWANGTVCFSPQFHWRDFHIVSALQNKFEYDVYVENDVKSAAMAESLFGIAKNCTDFMIVELGSGMGAAVVLYGKLYRGTDNATGEIGHILIDPDGIECVCGRKGCLQTFTCMTGIEKQAGTSFANVLKLAASGDEQCNIILEKAIQYSSIWIANLANFYNPSLILLYGKMLDTWPEMTKLLTSRHKDYLWAPIGKSLNIKESKLLQKDAEIISAASIVFSQYIFSSVEIKPEVLVKQKK